MIILIPAYEPDQQLPALIRSIRDAEPWATVVVVDDGSGPGYKDVFDGVRALGCHVIGYARNRGKGFALKTGFGFIADHLPGRNVVCADSDGQHTIADILRVATAVQPGSPAMVLGTRNFTGNVPTRSKFGNTATRLLFTLATGERISDTQTGLRGYPAAMLPWLRSVRGERYEYELNLLLEAKHAGYAITAVDIATVYLDHNSGSHFRPLADSVRIYAPLLKFLVSSFAAFLVDTVVFLLLTMATDSLLLAVVGARAVSSAVNFLVNRRVVFEHGRDRPAAAAGLRYFSLVIVLLAANYGLIYVLDALSVAALPAKILAEIALLAVSYAVQQRFLFSWPKGKALHGRQSVRLWTSTPPDVAFGVEDLSAAGHRLTTLANGSTQVAQKLFTKAGIRDNFELLLTMEDVQAGKPGKASCDDAASACDVLNGHLRGCGWPR